MPPLKGLPKSQAAAKEEGLVPMTRLFNPKVSAGHPPKKAWRTEEQHIRPTWVVFYSIESTGFKITDWPLMQLTGKLK